MTQLPTCMNPVAEPTWEFLKKLSAPSLLDFCMAAGLSCRAALRPVVGGAQQSSAVSR
eukprot:CAMPEP_0204238864 /NCGR_PEP_ID=MMETSP0361-20130328/94087_1 /ASSEMBLY_ACC=CAM_ASM_000343 /TAXON_ID=268821 /ORGANISM="Scrippsiella Hangoei, Strain SHTV-5" /LENGTH=57 /DNA_ID=CAMNT_0051211647 /DNA_START=379 /DNA_END=548 /DNA_ORIENTATION=+